MESLDLVVVMAFLVACGDSEPEDSGPVDQDPLAAHDTDGDGVLEVEDLSDGEVALHLTWQAPDTEEVEAVWTTEDAVLDFLEDTSWYVQATFPDQQDTELILRFRTGSSISEGTGTFEFVSLRRDADGLFLSADEPGGQVEVTFVGGGRASGWVQGTEPMLQAVNTTTGEPTGDLVTLHAAVFRTLFY